MKNKMNMKNEMNKCVPSKNAALLALEILGTTNPRIQLKMTEYRKQMHDKAAESGDQLV